MLRTACFRNHRVSSNQPKQPSHLPVTGPSEAVDIQRSRYVCRHLSGPQQPSSSTERHLSMYTHLKNHPLQLPTHPPSHHPRGVDVRVLWVRGGDQSFIAPQSASSRHPAGRRPWSASSASALRTRFSKGDARRGCGSGWAAEVHPVADRWQTGGRPVYRPLGRPGLWHTGAVGANGVAPQ